MSWVNQEPTNLPWMMARMDSCLVPSSESGRHRASLIRDREMSARGSTLMLDVFRKTVKIFNIMSEIPYLPVTG
jgi:hypothetical protein